MQRQGVTITGIRRRWWERTYAIPRWIVWLVVIEWLVALPRNIAILVGWLS